jgi:phosphoribosylaminoimidazole-succinocarboxamide synthase
MLDLNALQEKIPHALKTLDISWPYDHRSGKVRELYSLPGARRILVTTDRLSAFDVVLAALPYKGQVLNQLSAFWFEHVADIVPNHLLEVPDPNVSLVESCEPLPVEVIVRGFITGSTKTSLWTLYEAGNREIYGYTFPDGLSKNDPLPAPIITPTTKAGPGEHDERLTCDEVVDRGFLDEATWTFVQEVALEIFRRGQSVAEDAGFCLVDTKYEFGRTADGQIALIDEVHTPDSSRYWKAETMGDPRPDQWDKEYVRLWYAEQGYRGDGPPPELPDDVIARAAQRYIVLYEGLTKEAFVPAPYPAEPRLIEVLNGYRT